MGELAREDNVTQRVGKMKTRNNYIRALKQLRILTNNKSGFSKSARESFSSAGGFGSKCRENRVEGRNRWRGVLP